MKLSEIMVSPDSVGIDTEHSQDFADCAHELMEDRGLTEAEAIQALLAHGLDYRENAFRFRVGRFRTA